MKKAILLSFVLLGAIACGGQQKAAQPTEEAEVPAETTPAASQHLSGAYGTFRALTEADSTLFSAATAGLKGVAYTPDSVATQVVAGKNYRFICTARTTASEPKSYKAELVVFEPLPCNHEEPRITSISRIAAAD